MDDAISVPFRLDGGESSGQGQEYRLTVRGIDQPWDVTVPTTFKLQAERFSDTGEPEVWLHLNDPTLLDAWSTKDGRTDAISVMTVDEAEQLLSLLQRSIADAKALRP